MPDTPSGAQAALVELLDERGLLDPTWKKVWASVPRALFIPDPAWRQDPDRCVLVTGAARWDLIASDRPVVTQLDDGTPDGPGTATSSNSMPSMVAAQLAHLGLEDGDGVLEIGTATGYVAALLSERLGDELVHSIEIDPVLAATAQHVLDVQGYHPYLHQGDAVDGWPAPDAAFDAVLFTCATRTVPAAVLDQARPGARIVGPLIRGIGEDTVMRLVKQPDGSAIGRLTGSSNYMPMRAFRAARVPVDSSTGRHSDAGRPLEPFTERGFTLYASARLPDVRMWHTAPDLSLWAWTPDGSALRASADGVWEYGPRDLWAELRIVYAEYHAAGAPLPDAYGATVRGGDLPQVWIGSPDRVVSPVVR
ncbi:methyltransferase domain-containing protein [Streptomyces sp. NPDC088674]|uniref:methyltransferase domain-containing protein n=1 Tax=Streptomyces sp. NPDC088674 TaxID=3365869 RepID=UPI0037F1063C